MTPNATGDPGFDATRGSAEAAGRDPFLPNRRVRLCVLAVCTVALLVFGWINVRGRARLDAPGGHRSDFTVYTAAADAIAEGRSPYGTANVAGWGYLYPPLFAILVSPLRSLSPPGQAWVWFLLTLAMALASYSEVVKLVRWAEDRRPPQRPTASPPRPVPRWLALTSLATIFSPGIATMKWGQVGILLLWLVLLGARLALTVERAGAIVLGGVVLALAVAVKLGPIVPATALLSSVAWAAVNGRGPATRRRLLLASTGLAAGLVLWLLVVPGAIVGWRTSLSWLEEFTDRVVLNLGSGQRAGIDIRGPGNFRLPNAARSFAHALETGRLPISERASMEWPAEARAAYTASVNAQPTAVDEGIGRLAVLVLGWAVALLGVAGVVAFATETPLGGGAIAAMSLAIVPVLLLSPITWSHHYVLLQPATIFVPLWFWRRGAHRAAAWLALGLAAASCCQFLLLPYAWRSLPSLPFTVAAWLGLAAVTAWRVRSRAATAPSAAR